MKPLKRILQVEDDEDILEISGLSLETIGGFELEQYSLGHDAVRNAEQFAPDLFLLDMMMPVIGGVETLRLFRKNSQIGDVPAIFMTAKNLHEYSGTGDLGENVIGVIEKPFDTMELPNRIRALWDAYQSA